MECDVEDQQSTIDRPIRIGVVGAGIMGSGIAHVFALSGFEVDLFDLEDARLNEARAAIASSSDRLVASQRINAERADRALARISYRTDLADAVVRDGAVIESVVEDLEVKQRLFEQLDELCDPSVTLATNTSQFRVGRIAERCRHPERVVGMHWSNPPVLMMLVEIIRSEQTADATVDKARDLAEACGRETVLCRKDVPGFISNRLSNVLFMEALRLVDEGVADPGEVDAVARLMLGHKMGPLATLDLAGLDTALHVAEALDAAYGDGRFKPAPVLARRVAEGRLGRKSGSGFFDYL